MNSTCTLCGYESDTSRDMCEVCEDETELFDRSLPLYDVGDWDTLYESLESELK